MNNKEYQKKYRASNKGKLCRQRYESTEKGKLNRKLCRKRFQYSAKGKLYYNQYYRIPKIYIIKNTRKRMRKCLRGRSKSLHTLSYLGCSPEDWKLYLERHGLKIDKENHIDHIKPCGAFMWINVEQDLHDCFHYTNTRLIPVLDNLIKHDRFDEEHQILHEYYKLNGPSILKTLKQRQQSKKAYDMAIINDILCKNA